MRYIGERDYDHSGAENIGVLVANLGTPQAPTTRAVRHYLREFLSDPRVVEAPRLLWHLILNGWILPRRSPKTAAAYRSIWGEKGSPLLAISIRQCAALRDAFGGLPVKVELAMRYGQPSMAAGLAKLREQNCRRIIMLPLYPQYAASTVGSAFDAAAAELRKWRFVPQLRFIHSYCNDDRYIAALAESIKRHYRSDALLLFSFHGTPLKMLLDGDPYHCQCHRTARKTAEYLGLSPQQWRITFQSRFGGAEWLKPYTDDTLRALPKQGIKKVQVACPAFSADCLETLEEIAEENRALFMKAEGEFYSYIPALNDDKAHIAFLHDLIADDIKEWLSQVQAQNAESKTRAARRKKIASEVAT
ncbi:MAG: ferrochelatase [Gammaproteobacteria bacterium]